jgi:hypothetical protein
MYLVNTDYMIGQIPGVIGDVEEFVRSCRRGQQTKRDFLAAAKAVWELLMPYGRHIPPWNEVEGVVGQAYERYCKE